MIEKIVIKIGKKTIELTHDEAVQLQGELNGLFGDKYVPYVPTVPVYPTQPAMPWEYPIITYVGTTVS